MRSDSTIGSAPRIQWFCFRHFKWRLLMSLSFLRRFYIALPALILSSAGWADQSGVAKLAPNSFLNLETGVMSAANPDLLWDGARLMPQGRAELYNAGKYSARVFKTISERYAAAVSYRADPI